MLTNPPHFSLFPTPILALSFLSGSTCTRPPLLYLVAFPVFFPILSPTKWKRVTWGQKVKALWRIAPMAVLETNLTPVSYQNGIGGPFRAGTLGKVELITAGNFFQFVTPWITSWKEHSNIPIVKYNPFTLSFETGKLPAVRTPMISNSSYLVMEKFLLHGRNTRF